MKHAGNGSGTKLRPRLRGEPTWDIALLYPPQGEWTEEEYLDLDLSTRRLIEYSDGFLEILPVPTLVHQFLVQFLYRQLHEFISRHDLGFVLITPLPVRLWKRKWREPDVLFIRPEQIPPARDYPKAIDLAMEVVSEGKKARQRDLETKRVEYAKARIPEYWTIDPEKRRIVVLRLVRNTYRIHGEFGPGETATSALLAGFSVSADAVFAAGAKP